MQYTPKHGAETLQAVLKDVNSVDQSDLEDIYIDLHCVPLRRGSWFLQLWIYTTGACFHTNFSLFGWFVSEEKIFKDLLHIFLC